MIVSRASRFDTLPRYSRTAMSLAVMLACAGALTACGGGGGDGGGGPPTGGQTPPGSGGEPQVQKKEVPVTVIDGPIGKAIVCLDTNKNGACDSDEPTATTTADGKAVLTVDEEDFRKYVILAVAGPGAVDADHGPVTVPFTMQSPAGGNGVVSPLTTMVQAQVDSGGGTPAEAEQVIRSQLGLNNSLFEDFTAGAGQDSAAAAATARLVVVLTQKQNEAIRDAVGQADGNGGTITAQDLDRAVNLNLLNMMTLIAGTVGGQPAGASASDTNAAIESAGAMLAANYGLKADNVAAAVAANKVLEQAQSGDSSSPGGAPATVGWNLRWFQFTNTGNWLVRANGTREDQAVPDANGLVRYFDYRERSIGGVSEVFGESAWTRTDLYWDGAQWWNCPADFDHSQTPRDAAGVSTGTFCKTIETVSKRGVRDIGGVAMADVVREIRSSPLADNFGVSYGGFANWGPNPDSGVLGTARFPAGSKLFVQSSTDVQTADAYRPEDKLLVYPEPVAAGTGCPDTPVGQEATSLEQVIERNSSATPCSYTPSGLTGPKNDWWGNNTVTIGLVNSAEAPYSAYYASGRAIRVGFGAGNGVTWYSCMLRASNNSPRNCEVVGTGTYGIETKGDARVLRFAGTPQAAAMLGYDRLLIERAGAVHLGYHSKPTTSNQLRLNDKAASALFIQVGLPQLAD